jgi:SAM-dependent methyltransferase
MANPERFYKGANGQRYFNRFPEPHSDVAGLCFQEKTRDWIKCADRVLEFGAGTGANLMQLQVAEKACYDVSEVARAASSQAGLIVYDNSESIPRAYWSVVICHHVLEHVASPLDTLRLLGELLRPNGRLILTVPLEGHRRTLIPHDRDPDHHLYCWNPTTLRNLVEEADFSVVEICCRIAAREDIFAPMMRYSWPLFELAAWSAGMILRRGEMTCIAVARTQNEET